MQKPASIPVAFSVVDVLVKPPEQPLRQVEAVRLEGALGNLTGAPHLGTVLIADTTDALGQEHE